MRYRHLLIVTYGRSGSTLLQGVLNSIDGFLIRGENYGLCQGLFQAYESLNRAKAHQGASESSGDPSTPFFGAADFDKNRFLDDARALLLHQLAPQTQEYGCVGFKEIRYLSFDREPGHPASDKRLREYLWFLVRIFEDPAIILLTRDHDEVVRSGFWRKWQNPDRLRGYLTAFEGSSARFAKNYPHAFRLDYADLISQSGRLRELFDFLGVAYDPLRIAEVLDREHSFDGRRKTASRSADEQQRSQTGNTRQDSP